MMFALAIPGLEPIAKACAYALQWLATLVGGNYGVAIILLTILIRIVLLPLSIKQTKSMIAMQKLQPQLKEIQKKYKDDREKMGQEMMKLYKENKVSPLGGCLPLLLQLPVLFAVFEVLRNMTPTVKKKVGNKIVTVPSPYLYIFTANQTLAQFKANLNFLGMNITYTGAKLWSEGAYVQVTVLLLLTVATGYVTAKMMTTDPKQAKMMALMPLMFGVFVLILPVGVSIYIVVTNMFTLVQQYIQLEHEGFYDEKLAALRKLGDQAKWHQRTYLRSMEAGTKLLVAVHLRPVPKPAGKKKAGKGEVKQKETKTSGVPEQQAKDKKPPAKVKTGSKSSERPQSQQQKGKSTEASKSGSGKQSAKTQKKNYPAKKKSPGKR
jgi:YidC/Oxa1 family membrane protein insertase